mmetsp:Transcript_21692/g.44730  ORF Transcript_21692/g.44730 Transcript_21692/m.44730 type:complete len:670 (-) Transcript_21692:51-2060(-)
MTSRRKQQQQHPPVPTAILLRNALTPSPEHGDASVSNPAMVEEDRSGRGGRRRRLKSASGSNALIPSVRLELVADRTAADAANAATAKVQTQSSGGPTKYKRSDEVEELNIANLAVSGEEKQENTAESHSSASDVILHVSVGKGSSSLSPCLTLHPRWDHLDEKFDLFEGVRSTTKGRRDAATFDSAKFDQAYKSMRARVVVDVTSAGCLETEITKNTPFVLAELPIYPTELRRLPRSAGNISEPGDDDDDEDDFSFTPSADTASVTIPSALPPNALLIHYSDGTTRIDPTLYHRLVKAGIIKETKAKLGGRTRLDSGVIEDRIREDRKARRFDDDVFDMLGEGDGDGGGGGGVDTSIAESTTPNQDDAEDISRSADVNMSFKDDVFDLLDGGRVEDNIEEKPVSLSEAESFSAKGTVDGAGNRQENECRSPRPSHPLLTSASDVEVDDLRSEVEALRSLLAEEEEGLEHDRDGLLNEAQALSTVVEQTKHMKKEVELINEDAADQESKWAEVEFHLEARRAKLLRDLRLIYPIQCIDNVYTIRDLHLPSDLHGPSVPDTVISAALGYVCHLVYMCSKYLCIPLRYRLFCNSSRSAIQDDGVAVYPLFRERVIEREQFDRAFTLLGRNVECLLRGRGVDFYHRSHILAKLERLFVQTNEIGGTSSFALQ